MKIHTWESQSAPPSQRWLARFLVGGAFLPTFVSAPTEERAVAAAQKLWDNERTRLNKAGKPDPVRDVAVVRDADAAADEIDLLADLLG